MALESWMFMHRWAKKKICCGKYGGKFKFFVIWKLINNHFILAILWSVYTRWLEKRLTLWNLKSLTAIKCQCPIPPHLHSQWWSRKSLDCWTGDHPTACHNIWIQGITPISWICNICSSILRLFILSSSLFFVTTLSISFIFNRYLVLIYFILVPSHLLRIILTRLDYICSVTIKVLCYGAELFAQVVFEGIMGSRPRGDIAIDDVSILQGQCQAPGQFVVFKWSWWIRNVTFEITFMSYEYSLTC